MVKLFCVLPCQRMRDVDCLAGDKVSRGLIGQQKAKNLRMRIVQSESTVAPIVPQTVGPPGRQCPLPCHRQNSTRSQGAQRLYDGTGDNRIPCHPHLNRLRSVMPPSACTVLVKNCASWPRLRAACANKEIGEKHVSTNFTGCGVGASCAKSCASGHASLWTSGWSSTRHSLRHDAGEYGTIGPRSS
jgi:hypothetical protein